MGKNKLSQVVVISFFILLLLSLLSFIPEFKIGDYTFRRINIISDIIKQEKPKQDSVVKVKPQFIDTCQQGLICFEDFSPQKSTLDTFFSALSRIRKNKEIVRVAYFGDSFIEGDIMLEDLRDTLQTVFGGKGVGYVPITSMVAGFRETIVHSFANFKTYSILDTSKPIVPLGFSGMTFIPGEENYLFYHSVRRKRFLDYFFDIRLFYGKTDSTEIQYSLNKLPSKTARLYGLNEVNDLTIHADSVSSVHFRFPAEKNLFLYGASFEGGPGIYIDNFSVRGNSGYGLMRTPEKILRRMDSIQHYKLVVLHYGLNVVARGCKNYDWYKKMMNKVVTRVMKCFPHASVLLVSVSDRSTRKDGEYSTMPEIPFLLETQREIASENQIAFWNLFDAMGGQNSMVGFVDSQPPLANKDYTHLNFRGAKKVAGIFAQTILYEKFKYDRKVSLH